MEKWAKEAEVRAESRVAIGCGHSVVLSGVVAWCTECGSYADAKAKGLALPCKGSPKKGLVGGMAGQLKKQCRGQHPRTGAQLPVAIGLDGKEAHPSALNPNIAVGIGSYSNLLYCRYLKRKAEAATAYENTAWGACHAAAAAALPIPEPPQAPVQQDNRMVVPSPSVQQDDRMIIPSPPRSARQRMHEKLLRVRAKKARANSLDAVIEPVVRRRCSTKRAAGW